MPDSATSTDPAVQRQLDRLTALSPGADILGLERITRLLARIGDPHLRLPPVFHVAGTNGKGSTCAFLRAAIEAAGLKAHVYSSPHLVRFNERIRIAGKLIDDATLAPLLEEVLDAGGDIGASFFEVTTAAAFLAFARTRADACVIEVGLGGRLDATNVIRDPAVSGIARLGIDHQAFLGDTILDIAREKAGIAKPGRPLVISAYPEEVSMAVRDAANASGAVIYESGNGWDWSVGTGPDGAPALYVRTAHDEVTTPLPTLSGSHQAENLALAIAMIRHQARVAIPDEALKAAATTARWPARMQRLGPGPLTALLPEGAELWLDGGHNPDAGEAVAQALADILDTPDGTRPCHMILGMLANKDAEGLLEPIAPLLWSLVGVPVPGHEHHAPANLTEVAQRLGVQLTGTGSTIPGGVKAVAQLRTPYGLPPVILILGSLYLAGTVLEANGELPD
jgi:dihydrofolate synthase/folylpolyglutamate synthase